MKNSVDDRAMQFFVVRCFELFRICFYRIQADKKVARYFVAAGIIERDDIGVIIVLQILAVYLQDLFVGTKDIGDPKSVLKATRTMNVSRSWIPRRVTT